MPKLKNRFPKMCRDRNQAFSKHNGKRIYHGVWGSPEHGSVDDVRYWFDQNVIGVGMGYEKTGNRTAPIVSENN